MLENKHNLLTELLLNVMIGGRDFASVALPELMARMVLGQPVELTDLQPHQAHAWHAFTVQLAAIGAHHANCQITAMDDSAQWTEVLRALTGGCDEPWCLIVPDLLQPAFMQPPVDTGSITAWNQANVTVAPDEIDVLETAKNHDVKVQRVAFPAPAHWLFALVTLQTMQGYSGKENYGIARMNGGYGNRPSFAAARDLGSATRFVRDVQLMLEQRSSLIERHAYDRESGPALLWLQPWNGNDQVSLTELDPFFIEICRRIRLFNENGQTIARWTTSKVSRIAAKDQKGNLGDLWVPVRREDGAALTARNLNYEKLQEVIFGPDYEHSAASETRPADGNAPILCCQLLARDQGKTAGFHERFILIPVKAKPWLATADGRRRLGALSHQRVEAVKEVVAKLLRPSLCILIQADPIKLDFRDPHAEPFIQSFDREVDRVFFGVLFDEIDSPDPRRMWLERLLAIARSTLERAKQSVPFSSVRRFRACAAADRMFLGAARNLRNEAGYGHEAKEENLGTDER
jgi:CRISPR system Cascade subunit CasA